MLNFLFLAFLSTVSAGVIHDHYGPGPGVVVGAVPAAYPALPAAPVAVKAHVSTSFANSNLIALHPHPVAVAAAPVLPAGPALVAAGPGPIAPLVLGHGLGAHGYFGHH